MNNSLPFAFARLLKSLVTWLVCISAYGGKSKRSGYTNHIGGEGVPASKWVRTEWELGLYHNHSLSCSLDRGNEMRFYELKNGRVLSLVFHVICPIGQPGSQRNMPSRQRPRQYTPFVIYSYSANLTSPHFRFRVYPSPL